MLFTGVLHPADHLFQYIMESNMKFQVLCYFFLNVTKYAVLSEENALNLVPGVFLILHNS